MSSFQDLPNEILGQIFGNLVPETLTIHRWEDTQGPKFPKTNRPERGTRSNTGRSFVKYSPRWVCGLPLIDQRSSDIVRPLLLKAKSKTIEALSYNDPEDDFGWSGDEDSDSESLPDYIDKAVSPLTCHVVTRELNAQTVELEYHESFNYDLEWPSNNTVRRPGKLFASDLSSRVKTLTLGEIICGNGLTHGNFDFSALPNLEYIILDSEFIHDNLRGQYFPLPLVGRRCVEDPRHSWLSAMSTEYSLPFSDDLHYITSEAVECSLRVSMAEWRSKGRSALLEDSVREWSAAKTGGSDGNIAWQWFPSLWRGPRVFPR